MEDARRIRFGAYITACLRDDLTLARFDEAVAEYGASLGWPKEKIAAELRRVVREIKDAQQG
jgi:hypothetical protein